MKVFHIKRIFIFQGKVFGRAFNNTLLLSRYIVTFKKHCSIPTKTLLLPDIVPYKTANLNK